MRATIHVQARTLREGSAQVLISRKNTTHGVELPRARENSYEVQRCPVVQERRKTTQAVQEDETVHTMAEDEET